MKLADDDRVVAVFPGWDDYELLLVTADGQGIRFAGGRGAAGRPVGGRHPRDPAQGRRPGDRRVRGRRTSELVVIATEQGFAKRTEVDEFPVQARGGSGLEGRQDRQGARQARRGAPPRPTRSRSSRPTRAWSFPVRACAPRRATAAARRCAPRVCSASSRSRRRATTPDAPPNVETGYGAGFSTVFQSRVVRYVRNCSPTCARSSCVFGWRSS